MTENTDVLNGTERQLLIAMFETILHAEQNRADEVKTARNSIHVTGAEEVDRANKRIEYSRLDRDFRDLTLSKIPRLKIVVRELQKGWDATCVSCGDSVLPRLRKENPTLHCVACKEKLEQLEKQHPGLHSPDPGLYQARVTT